MTNASGLTTIAMNSQNAATRQRAPIIAMQAAIIAAVIGTCAWMPLKLYQAAGILINSTTPASATASRQLVRSANSVDTNAAQAQVKNPAPIVSEIAAAATGSILVRGTW